MNIYVGQIYIKLGVKFEFSYIFQRYIHSFLTENSIPSVEFVDKFQDYELIFNMSAKKDIKDNEIKGPAIFKKTKKVEYSIFLPFDVIMQNADYNYWALKYLFKGIYEVYDKYGFNYNSIKNNEEKTIKYILSDEKMFKKK